MPIVPLFILFLNELFFPNCLWGVEATMDIESPEQFIIMGKKYTYSCEDHA